jgi:uncharacterized protein (UPF0248 family)
VTYHQPGSFIGSGKNFNKYSLKGGKEKYFYSIVRYPRIREQMRTTHAILLKYYHDPRYHFEDISVCYRDRGAPGDRTCVRGERIIRLDAQYMEILSESETTAIPYHRITQIRYYDQIIWDYEDR